MAFLTDSARTALALILALDPDIVSAALTSLRVAACSILLAAVPAIPVGLAVGLLDFPGNGRPSWSSTASWRSRRCWWDSWCTC